MGIFTPTSASALRPPDGAACRFGCASGPGPGSLFERRMLDDVSPSNLDFFIFRPAKAGQTHTAVRMFSICKCKWRSSVLAVHSSFLARNWSFIPLFECGVGRSFLALRELAVHSSLARNWLFIPLFQLGSGRSSLRSPGAH
jgi:hypothetical protein